MTAKIPQSFIDELLARTDILNVIEPYVPLKKNGANYKACCPFHQEKTPSFTVSPSKQIFHCFGCGIGGNAISFLMEYEHMNYVEAIKTLAAQNNMELPQSGITLQQTDSTDLYNTMEKASIFYQTQLRKHPQANIAIDYLKDRGLSQEIVKRFKIGFAPPGWDNLLNSLNKNHKTLQRLISTGMVIQKSSQSTYDRFRNRIMFPIIDRRGRTIAFGGRVIDDNDTPKYLNSPETPIFHKSDELYGLHEAKQVNRQITHLLLVEGYMDVIALAQHNINYAVATLGTAITSNHIQRLFRTCSDITFCFDGDSAGRSAAWRTLEIILPMLHDNWQTKFIFLPDKEDPDSFVRKIGKNQFEELAKNADTLSTFFFKHLSQQTDLSQTDGRARLANSAMTYIKQMPANIMQEMMIEELAHHVNMRADALNKHLINNQKPTPENIAKATIKKQNSPLCAAITLLIQNPQLIHEVRDDLPTFGIKGISILQNIFDLLKSQPELTTGNILEYWREKPEYEVLKKLACSKQLLKQQNLVIEFRDIIKKLHLQCIEFTIESLLAKANTEGLNSAEKRQLQTLLKESKILN